MHARQALLVHGGESVNEHWFYNREVHLQCQVLEERKHARRAQVVEDAIDEVAEIGDWFWDLGDVVIEEAAGVDVLFDP